MMPEKRSQGSRKRGRPKWRAPPYSSYRRNHPDRSPGLRSCRRARAMPSTSRILTTGWASVLMLISVSGAAAATLSREELSDPQATCLDGTRAQIYVDTRLGRELWPNASWVIYFGEASFSEALVLAGAARASSRDAPGDFKAAIQRVLSHFTSPSVQNISEIISSLTLTEQRRMSSRYNPQNMTGTSILDDSRALNPDFADAVQDRKTKHNAAD